jgi:NAD-dependent dihydropyrimidine dehydrogenase PreA subunit
MLRKVINIDEEKCNGCGLCADACNEGAIAVIDGKAKLIRDDFCDGLGHCLPICPTGAISFQEREAAPYGVQDAKGAATASMGATPPHGGCPGSNSRMLKHAPIAVSSTNAAVESELRQWPVQIKLAPVNAPYFDYANLLVSADCAAYAYGDFHSRFMRGRITLIGCPKLDEVDYSEKLAAIISSNNIKSIMVVRMEVPCCSGIENAVKSALIKAGKMIPWRVVILSTEGKVLEE